MAGPPALQVERAQHLILVQDGHTQLRGKARRAFRQPVVGHLGHVVDQQRLPGAQHFPDHAASAFGVPAVLQGGAALQPPVEAQRAAPAVPGGEQRAAHQVGLRHYLGGVQHVADDRHFIGAGGDAPQHVLQHVDLQHPLAQLGFGELMKAGVFHGGRHLNGDSFRQADVVAAQGGLPVLAQDQGAQHRLPRGQRDEDQRMQAGLGEDIVQAGAERRVLSRESP